MRSWSIVDKSAEEIGYFHISDGNSLSNMFFSGCACCQRAMGGSSMSHEAMSGTAKTVLRRVAYFVVLLTLASYVDNLSSSSLSSLSTRESLMHGGVLKMETSRVRFMSAVGYVFHSAAGAVGWPWVIARTGCFLIVLNSLVSSLWNLKARHFSSNMI